MGNFIDLVGKRFGRLMVLERAENRGKRTRWQCKCDCGNTCIVCSQDLLNGDTCSCGCLQRELLSKRKTTHGLSRVSGRDPRYVELHVIHNRCYNPNNTSYHNYGGRGIGVEYVWNLRDNPDNALKNWLEWCGKTFYQKGLTCERKDVNQNYGPDNCEWIPIAEQSDNKRNSVRLKNGRSIISVLKDLGVISNVRDGVNQYRRVIYYFRKHGELPEEIVELAKSQNKLFLLED